MTAIFVGKAIFVALSDTPAVIERLVGCGVRFEVTFLGGPSAEVKYELSLQADHVVAPYVSPLPVD